VDDEVMTKCLGQWTDELTRRMLVSMGITSTDKVGQSENPPLPKQEQAASPMVPFPGGRVSTNFVTSSVNSVASQGRAA
jgi:hypothetical protein